MEFQGHKNVQKRDGSTSSSWKSMTCGHCDRQVSAAVIAEHPFGESVVRWLQCPTCADGSVQARNGKTYPGTRFGPAIQGLPDEVKHAYEEARSCMSVNAFTSAELTCRKILMHVAVEKGAKEGKAFVDYVTYLADQGYVTPPMKVWVDLIRKHGNESAHELDSPSQDRAEGTLMFTAELLRLVYEMDFMAQKYAPGGQP